ncbi:[acyl-carrier-protein] S-malonyltransferase [Alteromonadaceae bacterium Bs31]|nr:[acyl-carrier-protein] S-malonyltransferase [Alteromonadaceae bacterium Bs31]
MTDHKVAFVFPGQGSQKVGMLAELAENKPVVRETFAEASEVLGYDLWALIQNGPQEELNMTEKTQPALLACSVAVWRAWCDAGGAKPDWMAGHSLGEWSALVCADVVDFASALKLVRLRGKYMQEAVPLGVGAMAAIIGLADEKVEQACAQASVGGELASPVNYNSPGQLVIAGHKAAVESAMKLCSESGAKRAMLLPVSAPFHTALMSPAAEKLAAEVEATEFSAPAVPVVHNVNALPESDPSAIKQLMIEQIYSPVKWVASVHYLVEQGATATLECGPGRVLSGLIKRIDKSVETHHVEILDTLEASLSALQ